VLLLLLLLLCEVAWCLVCLLCCLQQEQPLQQRPCRQLLQPVQAPLLLPLRLLRLLLLLLLLLILPPLLLLLLLVVCVRTRLSVPRALPPQSPPLWIHLLLPSPPLPLLLLLLLLLLFHQHAVLPVSTQLLLQQSLLLLHGVSLPSGLAEVPLAQRL
jgi:hypothetical protein